MLTSYRTVEKQQPADYTLISRFPTSHIYHSTSSQPLSNKPAIAVCSGGGCGGFYVDSNADLGVAIRFDEDFLGALGHLVFGRPGNVVSEIPTPPRI